MPYVPEMMISIEHTMMMTPMKMTAPVGFVSNATQKYIGIKMAAVATTNPIIT
jgi:hypothetical protein